MDEGNRRKQQFYNAKIHAAKNDNTNYVSVHRTEIEDYEKEAEDLERYELELLNRLQATQQRERDAYGRLEGAMLETAIPKKQRVSQIQSIQHSLREEDMMQQPSQSGGDQGDKSVPKPKTKGPQETYIPLPVNNRTKK